MKKKSLKKLKLAKETVRELGHVVGGTNYPYQGVGTVETGCNFCETGSCCTCVNGCETTVCESYNC